MGATQCEANDAAMYAAARHKAAKIPGVKFGPFPASTLGVHDSERIAVLLNGNAKRVNSRVLKALSEVAGADLYVTRSIQEARNISRLVVEQGYGTVMIGGGDGTFVEWTSGIAAQAEAAGAVLPRFVVLPLGTGNAVATTLGAHAPTPWELRRLARRAQGQDPGETRSLELLEVEGKLTPFAGFGLDALILQDHQMVERAFSTMGMRMGANTSYALSVALCSLPRFVVSEYPEITVTNIGAPAVAVDASGQALGSAIATGDILYKGRAAIAAASTIPYVGLSLRLFPQIERHSGRFQLRISDASVLEILGHLPSLWRGTYQSDSICDFLCTGVLIETSPESPFQVGGDVVGHRERVVLELAQKRVRLLS